MLTATIQKFKNRSPLKDEAQHKKSTYRALVEDPGFEDSCCWAQLVFLEVHIVQEAGQNWEKAFEMLAGGNTPDSMAYSCFAVAMVKVL